MKIVLDTNVLVSAALNPRGKPADILNLIMNESIIPCYDSRIIDEYQKVLNRDIFGFKASDVDTLISYIADIGEHTNPSPLKLELTDEQDGMFYEVLIAAHADFLITGNLRHFKSLKDKRIISPKEFLEHYFSG